VNTMRTIPIRVLGCLFTLALLLAPGVARAQAVQVNASISPAQVVLGDSAFLEISVVGASDASTLNPPQAPSVNGLDIAYGGVRSNTSIINGRRSESVVFQYRVSPTVTGTFTIPAMTVDVRGRSISTDPLTISAIEPPVARDVKLSLKIDPNTVYEGQPVTALLTLAFSTDLDSVRFSTNTQATGIQTFDAPNPAERTADRVVGVDLDGRKVRGALGTQTIDGSTWRTLTMAYTIVPNRAGTIEIPGPIAVVAVVTGEEGFGLFRQNTTQRRVAHAPSTTLNVKPLPTEGRPANFSGLIGRFELSAAAEPTTVHVGEPITVRLSISGSEPLDRVRPPDLASIPSFDSSFKLSPEGWAESDTPPNTSPRARVFTTTIRATSDTISEIPSVTLPYFDTSKGEYRVASTKPIPLDVQETRQITAADAIGNGGGTSGGMHLPRVERVPLENASGGVAFAPIPTRLTSQHLLLTENLRSPAIASAIVIPPAALAVSAVVAIRRRTSDPQSARRRGALRAALRALGLNPSHESISEAMRVFLADRFSIPRATITAHDARRLVSPFDPVLADQAARALLAADATRFADAAPNQPFNAADVRPLLAKLDEVTHA